MKRNFLLLFSAGLFFVISACSSSRLAQKTDINDDVYNMAAKAKEMPVYVANEAPAKADKDYRTEEQLYGDRYNNSYNSYDYYDGTYASRINRFHNNSPWRNSYYDSWYNYSYSPWSYRYNRGYNYGPGVSIYIGSTPSWEYNPYANYRYDPYWGYIPYSPYNSGSRYWGPYSYNNYYPGYSYGGIYNNGGYNTPSNNSNSRSRPNREGVNSDNPTIYNSPSPISAPAPANARPQRSGDAPDNRPSSGRISSQPQDNFPQPSSRPVREATIQQPQPVQQQQPEPSRPDRSYSPPPSAPAPASPTSGGSDPSRPVRD